MTSDEVDFKMARPYYPMHYDKDFNFLKDRRFFFIILLTLGLITYGHKRYYIERDRMRRTERLGNIQNLPAHHFNNRGGVLIEKEFVGFEKYH